MEDIDSLKEQLAHYKDKEEKRKAKMKEVNNKNKQYRADYYQRRGKYKQKEMVKCDLCGCEIKYASMNNHKKSIRHISKMDVGRESLLREREALLRKLRGID